MVEQQAGALVVQLEKASEHESAGQQCTSEGERPADPPDVPDHQRQEQVEERPVEQGQLRDETEVLVTRRGADCRGGKHAMLRRHTVFDGLAADFTAATLLGRRAEGVIARILAGEEWVHV